MTSLLITRGFGCCNSVKSTLSVPPPSSSMETVEQKKLYVKVNNLTTEDVTDTKQRLKVKVESIND